MGQYYKPVNLNNKEWLYSHSYDDGLKLMEHSWIDNNFVKAVETLLQKGNTWYKANIVWAGDYADPEPTKEASTIYDQCEDKNEIKPKIGDCDYPFIVNHTKKLFVDKRKGKKDQDGWQIHPLPLLTCEGNGGGNGDFRGEDKDNIIGSWSRDSISIEEQQPKDYKEINFNLTE